jgi:hypothetical protein
LEVRVGARTGAPKGLILLSQVRQVRQVRMFRGSKLLFLTIYVLDETTSARKNTYTPVWPVGGGATRALAHLSQ